MGANADQDRGLGCGQGNVQPDSVRTWTAIRIHGPAAVIHSSKLGQIQEFVSMRQLDPKYYLYIKYNCLKK